MIEKIKQKLFTREIILYLVAGVLTTIVNIISYHIFCNIIGIESLISNGIAWVLSVLFAYVANDRFVFVQEKMTKQQEFKKFIKFITARLFSFGVDEAGMFLFVEIVFVHNIIAKIIMNVIVVILNYIFSKVFIFKNKDTINIEDEIKESNLKIK